MAVIAGAGSATAHIVGTTRTQNTTETEQNVIKAAQGIRVSTRASDGRAGSASGLALARMSASNASESGSASAETPRGSAPPCSSARLLTSICLKPSSLRTCSHVAGVTEAALPVCAHIAHAVSSLLHTQRLRALWLLVNAQQMTSTYLCSAFSTSKARHTRDSTAARQAVRTLFASCFTDSPSAAFSPVSRSASSCASARSCVACPGFMNNHTSIDNAYDRR